MHPHSSQAVTPFRGVTGTGTWPYLAGHSPTAKTFKKQETWPGFAKLSAESMKLGKTVVFAETWPPEQQNRETAGCATVGEPWREELSSSPGRFTCSGPGPGDTRGRDARYP